MSKNYDEQLREIYRDARELTRKISLVAEEEAVRLARHELTRHGPADETKLINAVRDSFLERHYAPRSRRTPEDGEERFIRIELQRNWIAMVHRDSVRRIIERASVGLEIAR